MRVSEREREREIGESFQIIHLRMSTALMSRLVCNKIPEFEDLILCDGERRKERKEGRDSDEGRERERE